MEKRKNYRIKSKRRFIMFIIITLMVLAAGITTALGLNNVNGVTQQKYVEVQVMAGETMWDIAARYKSNDTDLRKVVYDIQQHNNLETADLMAGETIKVPIQ